MEGMAFSGEIKSIAITPKGTRILVEVPSGLCDTGLLADFLGVGVIVEIRQDQSTLDEFEEEEGKVIE